MTLFVVAGLGAASAVSAQGEGNGDGYGVGRRDLTGDVVVLYPIVAVPAGPTTTDVRPAGPPAADGPFPLVVFVLDGDGVPEDYVSFLEPVVRRGYVVAIAGDASSTIDRLLALSAQPDGWLAGRLDPERIAVAGRVPVPGSDDPRIDTVAALSEDQQLGFDADGRRTEAALLRLLDAGLKADAPATTTTTPTR